MNSENVGLYEKLLELDRSVFTPLMEEILGGRLDIEDTRPVLGITMGAVSVSGGDLLEGQRRPLVQTPEDLAANVKARLFAPEEYIREVEVPDRTAADVVAEAVAKYEERTGTKLSQPQIDALVRAREFVEKTDVGSWGKTGQTILSARLSPDPVRK
jgi:hypothetical protein